MTPLPDALSQPLDGVLQMIEQNDEKAELAHARLREDLRALEKTVESNFTYLNDKDTAMRSRVDTMAATPVSAEKLVMTPRVVIVIVTTAVTIAGGIWASTSGVRSDVRDILTRMDAQKTASEAMYKLQDAQNTALRMAVDDVKRRQELQQYEIQAFKEVLLAGKVKIQ